MKNFMQKQKKTKQTKTRCFVFVYLFLILILELMKMIIIIYYYHIITLLATKISIFHLSSSNSKRKKIYINEPLCYYLTCLTKVLILSNCSWYSCIVFFCSPSLCFNMQWILKLYVQISRCCFFSSLVYQWQWLQCVSKNVIII